jgi:hypothetical protein
MTYLFIDTLSSEVVTDVNFKITILWNVGSCTYQTIQLHVTGDLKLNLKQLLVSSVPLAAVSSSLLHTSLVPLVQFASSSIRIQTERNDMQIPSRALIFLEREGSQGLNTERHDCSEDQKCLRAQFKLEILCRPPPSRGSPLETSQNAGTYTVSETSSESDVGVYSDKSAVSYSS